MLCTENTDFNYRWKTYLVLKLYFYLCLKFSRAGESSQDHEMLLDETLLDKTLLDKTSLDKTSLDETSLDETLLDKTSLDEISLDDRILYRQYDKVCQCGKLRFIANTTKIQHNIMPTYKNLKVFFK
jgi:hypothetical protein